jgi:uncharacterized protein
MEKVESMIRTLPQLVPESWCRECKICCRFPDSKEVQTPTWSALEAGWLSGSKEKAGWLTRQPKRPSLSVKLAPCGSGYRCPAFKPEGAECTIYEERPLDCRLYPFTLAHDSAKTKVVLAMDLKCPYLEQHATDPEVADYAQKLADILESPEGLTYLGQNPKLIGPFWPEFIAAAPLPQAAPFIRPEVRPPHPDLKPLRFEQIPMLSQALGLRRHTHSSYTLAGLLGWSDLMSLWWIRLEGALVLFAEQSGGFFMPVPPLDARLNLPAFDAAWALLVRLNAGSGLSRIQGVEPEDLRALEAHGFSSVEEAPEYLYRRSDLAQLKGNAYKSQRWQINRFGRCGPYQVRPYRKEDLQDCLRLYTLWGIRQARRQFEAYPKALIRDGLFFHRSLMMHAQALGLVGRVLEVEGKIFGYTFAAPVSPETAVVFLEITDRALPGSAQLLFRALCRELEDLRWINAMGDEGLPGLRAAKKAYRPVREMRAVTLKKSQGALSP